MIHSMTGFGAAQLEHDGLAYSVEVRSVNNRYLKTTIRLPEEFAFVEPELERVLRQKLTRGSVTLRLFVRNLTDAAAPQLNIAAVRHYLAQLRTAFGDDPSVRIDLAQIATLPGVVQPAEMSEEQREQAAREIEKITFQALDHLADMRRKEGVGVAADLAGNCQVLRRAAEVVLQRCPRVVEEYRDRLQARIQQLLAGTSIELAAEDVRKEVAIFAERCDVNEELQRLRSHLEQFEAAMQGGEPAGRRLDFIAQELLRETNTIGSKANDAEIAQQVITMKTAIDRIKEQVQNVE